MRVRRPLKLSASPTSTRRSSCTPRDRSTRSSELEGRLEELELEDELELEEELDELELLEEPELLEELDELDELEEELELLSS